MAGLKSSTLQLFFDGLDDFGLRRKKDQPLLDDNFIIHQHAEFSPPTAHHLRFHLQLILYCVRQTGGSWSVATSDWAVANRHGFHMLSRLAAKLDCSMQKPVC